MSQPTKEGGAFPFTGLAAVVLVALGVAVQQLPLESTRPAQSRVNRDAYPPEQKVPARLWQDPFDATASEPDSRNAPPAAERRKPRVLSTAPEVVQQRIQGLGKSKPCVSLMPVMVFGGPYGEYAEVRRRTRYAVVSGLLRSGFTPEDEDRIGYMELSKTAPAGEAATAPIRVPFEWYERRTKDDPQQDWARNAQCRDREHALVLWIDEDSLADKPIETLEQIVAGVAPKKMAPDRVRLIGPAGSQTFENMVAELGKYAEDAKLAEEPADGNAGAQGDGGGDDENESGAAHVAAAAPAAEKKPRSKAWAYPAPLEIFVWGATTPGDQLTGGSGPPLTARFARHGITLLRTNADDLGVIRRIRPELAERGVVLGRDPIAIISESETLYGRQLSATIRKEVTSQAHLVSGRPEQVAIDDLVIPFNYFRGLDGETAYTAGDVQRDSRGKDEKRRPSELPDASSGFPQLDYAKRIAAALRERHDELRQVNSKIAAIGVLGTDFYDKSLLLQALKKEMPQAVFFTTDLDARMTDANQTRWSRNLLVFSGLGLALEPGLQGGIPPFRDAYQTSAFLSTLLAVNMPLTHGGKTPATAREGVIGVRDAAAFLEKRLVPRAYEVGQHEFFDYGPKIRQNGHGAADSKECELAAVLKCASLYPKASAFVQLESLRSILFSIAIVLGGIGLVLGTSRFAREKVGEALVHLRKPVMMLLVGFFFALAAWGFVLAWSDAVVREPFRWAEGLSAWPSLMLRYVAALLSVWFLYALVKDHRHMQGVLERFRLPTQPSEAGSHLLPWWLTKVKRFIQGKPYFTRDADWSIYKWVTSVPCASGTCVDAKEVARQYLLLSSAERRFDRVLPVVVCYLLLGFSLVFLWDFPGVPIRGAGTQAFHVTLLFIYVIAYALLLFAIVDAVRLFDALVEKLMRAETEYGSNTLAHFRSELRLEKDPLVDRYLADWIDIQFIAEQSQSTVKLVYFPFVILAIWLVARSHIFDAWYTPLSLVIIFVLGGIYTAYCTIRLRKTAENARSTTIESMTRLLVAIRGRLAESAREAAPALHDPQVQATQAAHSQSTEHLLKQLEVMLDQVKTIQRGAFMPLSQQPLWKAVLLPLSGFGGIELLQYVWMVNT